MSIDVAINHRLGGFTIDATFRSGAGLTALFGRSGAGKTTVVNAVAGLLRPEQGRVTVDGQVLLDTQRGIVVPPHRRRIGYVFQEGRLFPHLSVRQNLGFGRWFQRHQHRFGSFADTVELLGIGHLLERRPGSLSGGEKQRVAIGRALLASPMLLLMDEPLASLDEARKAEILPFLERLRDEADVPMLHVSHSAAEVARLATTVVVLDGGRVVRQGPAAEVLGDPGVTPLGARAAGAVLEARVRRHHDDGLSELDAGGLPLFLPRVPQAPGTALRLRIAAHDVLLSRERPQGLSALNILPAVVHEVRPGGGPGAIVSLDTAAGRVLARVTQRSALALGLAPGVACHAVIKTVAVAPEDIGR